jgi:hypothetical protein
VYKLADEPTLLMQVFQSEYTFDVDGKSEYTILKRRFFNKNLGRVISLQPLKNFWGIVGIAQSLSI